MTLPCRKSSEFGVDGEPGHGHSSGNGAVHGAHGASRALSAEPGPSIDHGTARSARPRAAAL